MPPETFAMTLRHPVSVGSVQYTTVELREPRAGEMAKANNAGNGIEVAIALISLVAKIPRTAVEQFCARDLEEASAYLSGFTVGGQETGSTS